MPTIPAFLLKKLYVAGSLTQNGEGFGLTLKNTVAPGTLIGISQVSVDGVEVPLQQITIGKPGAGRPADKITSAAPYAFGLNVEAVIWVKGVSLEAGSHQLTVTVKTREVGELKIQVEDEL